MSANFLKNIFQKELFLLSLCCHLSFIAILTLKQLIFQGCKSQMDFILGFIVLTYLAKFAF